MTFVLRGLGDSNVCVILITLRQGFGGQNDPQGYDFICKFTKYEDTKYFCYFFYKLDLLLGK